MYRNLYDHEFFAAKPFQPGSSADVKEVKTGGDPVAIGY